MIHHRRRADPELDALRRRILLAALPHVPFDGWSMAVLRAGAEEAGLDPVDADRAFPRGPVEAIEFHSILADRRVAEAAQSEDFVALRTRDRVAALVRYRLESEASNREAIRRALTVLSLPQNAPVAARSLCRTVDAIWRGAGDTATDFNFYTKRGLLAGVYAATVLYWLDDRSEGFEATWRFLDRRLDGVLRIPRIQARISRLAHCLPDPLRILRRRVPAPRGPYDPRATRPRHP